MRRFLFLFAALVCLTRAQADKSNYAPVRDRGLLTNLPFNWTYQESDLLINIKAQPREINKRTMYLTVRDVEDLNGNKLPSPVMWTVYANLNSIVWSEPAVRIMTAYESLASFDFQVFIINQTGMTRQYTIDNLPTWLAASTTQGTLEAEGNKMVTFTASPDLKRIFVATEPIPFRNDANLGSIAEPYTPSWKAATVL